MITNCPNCGAVLDAAGHCAYCKTRVVPTLDIFNGNAFGYGSITELNINVMHPAGKFFTIPLEGHIDSVEVSSSSFEENEVTFTFTGRIRNDAT